MPRLNIEGYNRKSYAVAITFIGLFFLVFIINGFFQGQRYFESEFGGKGAVLLMGILFYQVVYILFAFMIEMTNAINFDISVKVAERTIKSCGGKDYFQNETPEDRVYTIIKAGITKEDGTVDTTKIPNEFSKTFYGLSYNYYGALVSVFGCASYVLYQVLKIKYVATGTIEEPKYIEDFKLTNPKVSLFIIKQKIGWIIIGLAILVGVILRIAFLTRTIKLEKQVMDITTKKYTTEMRILWTIILITSICLVIYIKSLSNQYKEDPTFDLAFKVSVVILGFGLLLFAITYFYIKIIRSITENINKYYINGPIKIINEKINLIRTTYATITGSGYTSDNNPFTRVLHSAMLQMNPSGDASVTTFVTNNTANDVNLLYKYIKHRDGRELDELNRSEISGDSRTTIDAAITEIQLQMALLRKDTKVKDTVNTYTTRIFGVVALAFAFTFYLFYHSAYKDNAEQVTTITVLGIILLLIVAATFGWLSSSLVL